MMKAYIIVALFCLAGYTWSATPFKDCGSELGSIQEFQVTDCNAAPCVLKKGNTYSMNLTFQAKGPSKAVQVAIHGVIAGVPVPFPLNNSDACTLGVKCPVNSTDVNIASLSLPVLTSYPSLSLYVKIELESVDQKQDYTCLEFPAVISSGSHLKKSVDFHKSTLFEKLN